MIVDLVGTSENLVVLESVFNFRSFVQSDVAWIWDSVLVAKIVKVSREILDKVLTIEMLNWWSLGPLFLNLLGLLKTISNFNIMELDAGIVVLSPLVDFFQVLGWDLSVWNLNGLILLLERIENSRMSWESFFQGCKVDLREIGWELADSGLECSAHSLHAGQLGSVLWD